MMAGMSAVLPSWKLIEAHVRSGRPIIGIDEVGRGAWAGPVVAAAVILPPELIIEGLADSKLLTPAQRKGLNRQIRRYAQATGIGWVAPTEVDVHGLSWAVRQSGLRALIALNVPDEAIIILDGRHNYLADAYTSETYIKGDATIVPVAAASVVAKVARDSYMMALSRRTPGYSFELHKGYGTRAHQKALAQLGASVEHRHSYAPLRKLTP